ncbi:MAG: hypothetical protein KGJ58_01020 [Patescibacteria group bacterium]|nr:hypothetical protein [Patescibacteria group bacterium]MDE1988180.1 hypothetical protein [Patescibacteria group bacterium]MDE2218022.1 hypothetical protein [Patescibacteria group bacterium]
MNKTTKNIIILAIVAIILASSFFYFWKNGAIRSGPSQTSENISGNPFPVVGKVGSGGSMNFSTSSSVAISGSSPETSGALPTLRQISSNPVAGGIGFGDRGATIIRYVERGTGHIRETRGDSLKDIELSNVTIPKAVQSVWSPNGQSVIMRYVNEETQNIYSFLVNIAKPSTNQNISKNPKNVFLPSSIDQISVNPSGDKIFYLINDANGTVGIISNTDGSQKKQIFQSPIKEWLISWPNKETVALATKPSSDVPGYLFFLNGKTGAEKKILSGINGLTALVSSDTKNILYSESGDSSVALKYHNLKSAADFEFSFKTLPEKCVWSRVEESVVYCAVPDEISTGDYPDIWYQGLASFSDSIWKVDTKTKFSELILDTQKETSSGIDITNLVLSDNDEYLLFTNKKDLSFWSLNLKKQKINKDYLENSSSF